MLIKVSDAMIQDEYRGDVYWKGSHHLALWETGSEAAHIDPS